MGNNFENIKAFGDCLVNLKDSELKFLNIKIRLN